jgi:CPA2 family monovalent cation:H+ antiporter-2
MALGAFLAGMIVGTSDYSLRAATDALPMRDAFAVLFFVSVGMLLRPASVLDYPGFALTPLAIVMIGKPLTAALVTWLMGYPLRTTLTVAVALSQIGEFSFILVTLGRDLGIVPAEAMDLVVLIAIISITLNPLAFAAIDPVDRWIAKKRAGTLMSAGTDDQSLGGRLLVAGSGQPRDRDRLRPDWKNRHAPAARERHLANCGGPEYGARACTAR